MVKNAQIFLFIVPLLVITCYGQQGFNKAYSFNGSTAVFMDAVYHDGYIYVSADITDTVAPVRDIHALIKIDLGGNVVDTIFNKLTYHYLFWKKNLCLTLDSGLLATGNLWTPNYYTAVLYKYKADSLQWYQEFTDTTTMRTISGRTVISAPDGSIYLLISHQENDYNVNTVIKKLTGNGEVIWSRKYGITSESEVPSCMLSLADGHLLVGASKSNTGLSPIGSPHYYPTWLFKIDTAGNVLNEWTDTDMRTWYPGQVAEAPDGGYVYCGGYTDYYSQNGSPHTRNYIAKLDNNFNKEWDLLLQSGYYSLEDIIIYNDEIYAVGLQGDTTLQDNFGMLIKLTLDGDINYLRYFDIPQSLKDISFQSFKFLYSIDIPNDSTIIMAGQIQVNFLTPQPNLPHQYGWLIKTDLYGCLADTCRPDTVPVAKPYQPEDTNLLLFPNPTQGYLQLNIPVSRLGSRFTIADMQGRILQRGVLIASATVFDVHNYSAGVYAIRVEKDSECETLKFVKE